MCSRACTVPVLLLAVLTSASCHGSWAASPPQFLSWSSSRFYFMRPRSLLFLLLCFNLAARRPTSHFYAHCCIRQSLATSVLSINQSTSILAASLSRVSRCVCFRISPVVVRLIFSFCSIASCSLLHLRYLSMRCMPVRRKRECAPT